MDIIQCLKTSNIFLTIMLAKIQRMIHCVDDKTGLKSMQTQPTTPSDDPVLPYKKAFKTV